MPLGDPADRRSTRPLEKCSQLATTQTAGPFDGVWSQRSVPGVRGRSIVACTGSRMGKSGPGANASPLLGASPKVTLNQHATAIRRPPESVTVVPPGKARPTGEKTLASLMEQGVREPYPFQGTSASVAGVLAFRLVDAPPKYPTASPPRAETPRSPRDRGFGVSIH